AAHPTVCRALGARRHPALVLRPVSATVRRERPLLRAGSAMETVVERAEAERRVGVGAALALAASATIGAGHPVSLSRRFALADPALLAEHQQPGRVLHEDPPVLGEGAEHPAHQIGSPLISPTRSHGSW